MSVEEKAKKLIEMFMPFCFRVNEGGAIQVESAKQCALIAVDEILECVWKESTFKHWKVAVADYTTKEFWEQVKTEINKL